jgi:hypothetical protein
MEKKGKKGIYKGSYAAPGGADSPASGYENPRKSSLSEEILMIFCPGKKRFKTIYKTPSA